jgi:hypothetical protein
MKSTTIPPDFVAEAEAAFALKDRAHLILQSLEVEGMTWSAVAQALTHRLLTDIYPIEPAHHVVLFSGHRIDAPNRTAARFPSAKEPVARAAILEMLRQQQAQGNVSGMSGAANGGDILFLEACRQLAIPFRMLLALPESQFVAKSVAGAPGNWVERFKSLAHESQPAVLAETKTLPAWLTAKENYNFWARNNLWMISCALAAKPRHFVLAALWDGSAGDGPGGTENMVVQAQRFGAQFIHLDTRKLFETDPAIRTAEP